MEYLLVWVFGVICGMVLMLNVVSRRLGCVQSTLEEIKCRLQGGKGDEALAKTLHDASGALKASIKKYQKA